MLGLTQVQLERLADPENVSVKTSRRDLQYVISQVWKHMLYLVLLSELGWYPVEIDVLTHKIQNQYKMIKWNRNRFMVLILHKSTTMYG